MKRHITKHRIPVHSPEWHAFRYNGIGASEISSVLATVSKTIADLTYTPPIKYFLAKVGEKVQEFTGNVASNSGIYFEPILLQWYKAMDLDDPDQLKMFENLKNNIRINRAWQPKEYVVNEKYPWLFCSPDAYAKKNGVGKTRLVENKWTTSMAANRYSKIGVDPAFFAQVQQGLLVTELECADLNVTIDGRYFQPITIEPHKEVQEKILETSHDMWKRVIKARMLKIEYDLPVYYALNPDSLTEKQKEGVELISQLEPELIGTDDELEFVREMVKPVEEDVEMIGTEEQLELCLKYHNINDSIAALKKESNLTKAELILQLSGFNKAVFNDGNSFYSYKNDVNGIARLYVNKKMIKSEEI